MSESNDDAPFADLVETKIYTGQKAILELIDEIQFVETVERLRSLASRAQTEELRTRYEQILSTLDGFVATIEESVEGEHTPELVDNFVDSWRQHNPHVSARD